MAARLTVLLALVVALAGAGASGAAARPADGIPRLAFRYDASAPLGYADRGVVKRRDGRIAVHDDLVPQPGSPHRGLPARPAGEGTPPGGRVRPRLGRQPRPVARRGCPARGAQRRHAHDHRALDLVPAHAGAPSPRSSSPRRATSRCATSSPSAAPWTCSARCGRSTRSASATSAGVPERGPARSSRRPSRACGRSPCSRSAPRHWPRSSLPRRRTSGPQVRRVLGSVDPIRYIGWARPRTVLLADGEKDEVVPHAALLNIARAAPKGTVVRWYDAPHALNAAAYRYAFDWLARKLRS